MNAFFAATSVAAMFALALPATAADSTACQASWSKMDAQKTGFITGADAQKHRDADAPMHSRDEIGTPALLEIRQADGDNEEGFEPFSKSDDERLKHEC